MVLTQVVRKPLRSVGFHVKLTKHCDLFFKREQIYFNSSDIQAIGIQINMWISFKARGKKKSNILKIPLIKLRINLNIKSSDETGKSCCFWPSKTKSLKIHFYAQLTTPPLSWSMQIIPAECRYLGLFVMVEVYHSLRLCCAASHELMMNGRDGGEREREGREMQRADIQSDRKEKTNARLRLVGCVTSG